MSPHDEVLAQSLTCERHCSGVFWNAFMADKTSLFLIATWDTAQMSNVEIEGHCDALGNVLRKLTSESNWDKTVEEVFLC